MSDNDSSALDGRFARGVAALVLVGALAALGYFHRADLFPPEAAEVSDANPELAACIAERTGHVDRMLEDGVVSADQAASFRERAIQFCESQFPPIGGE